MSRASALAVLLRRDRSDVAALFLVAVLVGLTAFIAVAGVRLFERTADSALQRAVAAAPVGQRTIRLADARAHYDPTAIGTIDAWRAEGERQRAAFPEPVANLVGDANIAIASVRLRVSDPPSFPVFVRLRYQDDLAAAAELVSGRWPVTTNQQLPPIAEFPRAGPSGLGPAVPTNHDSDPPRRFEIAIQEATARAVGMTVGGVYPVAVDVSDPLHMSSILRTVDVTLAPAEVEITGLYRPSDPASDAWFGDPGLASDDLGQTMDQPIASINAYVAADALPGLMSSGLTFEHVWRFPIQIDRLDANAVEATERGLRLFDSQAAGGDSGDVDAENGLLPLFERHSMLRGGTEAVLTLAASAPLALAAGAIAMAAVLLSGRRRAPMVLARGRGATSRQLFAVSLVEAVLIAVVASLAGLVLAVVVEPNAELAVSILAACTVGVVAVVLLVGAAWPQIRQPLAELEGIGRSVRGSTVRRLVLELMVVVLAVVGAYVLRQRGIAVAGSPSGGGTEQSAALDPFLAAVPALIALAVGIVALRLYRPLMAAAGWVADRRRDLVPVLSARTIARGAASGMPVLVLLLAVAFAAFMSVVSNSIGQAQQTASWLAVGADVRIDPTGERRFLPTENQIRAVPGVTTFAAGFIDGRARAPATSGVGSLAFYAVDAAAYGEVVAGSPIEPSWPAELLRQPEPGTVDAPLPAIISSRLTGGQLGLGEGDTFQILIRGRALELQVIDVRSDFPGLVSESAFVVISYPLLQQIMGSDVPPTVMWIRAAPEAIAPLTQLVRPETSAIRLQSRYAEYEALRDQPLVGAVGAGFLLALAVSLAYAVLTILGSVVLSASRRTRDSAILKTLGLNRPQQTRLTIFEHAPPIVLALPIGLSLGIGVAFAVSPAVDLGRLAGSRGTIPLLVDWVALGLVSVGLAAVALAAVIIGTWLSRRTAIMNALRITSD